MPGRPHRTTTRDSAVVCCPSSLPQRHRRHVQGCIRSREKGRVVRRVYRFPSSSHLPVFFFLDISFCFIFSFEMFFSLLFRAISVGEGARPIHGDLAQQGKPRTWTNPAKSNKTIHPPRKMREPGPPPPRPGFHPPGQQPGHWAHERSPMIWNTMGYHAATLGHDVMYEHQGPQWIPPPPVTPPEVGEQCGSGAWAGRRLRE